MIDIKRAAQKLNLTLQQVRNLCREGKIKAEKCGNSWVISEEELTRYYDNSTNGVAENQSHHLTRNQILSDKKPIVLSFFSGAMGLDIGLEKAGFKTLLASEIDNACRKTILKNKPNIALIGDIRNYTPDEILEHAGLTKEDEIDLIAGGPPCQAFSTAGKRKAFEDERGNVFLNFIEVIKELRPKFAVLENVRGLLSTPLKHRPHHQRGNDFPPLSEEEQKGGALFHIISELENAGFSVSFNLYNAANYGTAQKRERVVIICSRDGKKAPFIEPTHHETGAHGLKKWRTFKDVVKSLNGIEHHHVKFPEKRLQYYKMLKAGENWKALPLEVQKKALGASFYASGGKTGFLRRLAWDKPAPTLVTHPAMPATDLAHPTENRPLSIEEYKRVQDFPDSWKIEGSLLEQYRQVGNAVPVTLGKSIGEHLMKIMNGAAVKIYHDFKYSRYNITDDEAWKEDFVKRLEKQRKMELTSS
ncbi:MAG: DNA cytosine methyltransferase [Saprospiraceae bacterium]|jgi:DNA (cytosine-5)-methyltransferase 1|nr:DNA cytosine methyltransferase [Saprospiraceae bacterium]